MEVKVIDMQRIQGTSGAALRISLAKPSYQPIRMPKKEGEERAKYVERGAIKVGLDNLSGDAQKRPVFQQNNSIFSTIQPVELETFLRVGDTLRFEPSSWRVQQVESKGTYLNARGELFFNSYQIARLVERLLGGNTNTGTKQEAPSNNDGVVVDLTSGDNMPF